MKRKFSLAQSTLVLTIAGIFLFLAGMAMLSRAMAAEPYPFPQDACGAVGTLLATAQHVRNNGMSLDEAARDLAGAEKGCEEKYGAESKDACLLQSTAAKHWIEQRFQKIWAARPTDEEQAGQDAVLECSAQGTKPVM